MIVYSSLAACGSVINICVYNILMYLSAANKICCCCRCRSDTTSDESIYQQRHNRTCFAYAFELYDACKMFCLNLYHRLKQNISEACIQSKRRSKACSIMALLNKTTFIRRIKHNSRRRIRRVSCNGWPNAVATR